MQAKLIINFQSAEVAREREIEGDLFLQDVGQGLGFRPGTFDGCIRYIFLSHLSESFGYKTSFT